MPGRLPEYYPRVAVHPVVADFTRPFPLPQQLARGRTLVSFLGLDGFEHSAVYDEENARVEMRLVSRRAQVVGVAGVAIAFRAGEHIVSEHSHKYSRHELTAMASAAGWRLCRSWVDDAERFAVYFLRA